MFETGAILDRGAIATSKSVALLSFAVLATECKSPGFLAWLASHSWVGSPGSFDLPEPFAGFCAITGLK